MISKITIAAVTLFILPLTTPTAPAKAEAVDIRFSYSNYMPVAGYKFPMMQITPDKLPLFQVHCIDIPVLKGILLGQIHHSSHLHNLTKPIAGFCYIRHYMIRQIDI